MKPDFTRRHYRAIADRLTLITDTRTRRDQARHWCEVFERDNERFDKSKFLQAAKTEV